MEWKVLAGYLASALGALLGGAAMLIVNRVNADHKTIHERISTERKDRREAIEKVDERLRDLENHKARVEEKLSAIERTTAETRLDVKKLLSNGKKGGS